MKTWFALLPITALLLGGAVGCESEYDQNARTNTGIGADNDNTGLATDEDAAAEGRMGDTRRDLGADMGTARDDAGIGADAEAGADTDRPATGMGTGTGAAGTGTGTGMGTGAAGTGAGAAAGTGTAGQREMTGTLEVQDETASTFQLDGDGATCVAPSTANLDQLDGEEVTVTIDASGRVVSVSPAADRES